VDSYLTSSFQAAVYGIGICAEFGGCAFRPHTGGICFTYCETDYFIFTFVGDIDYLFLQRHSLGYTM
jgi:hypothetical protein